MDRNSKVLARASCKSTNGFRTYDIDYGGSTGLSAAPVLGMPIIGDMFDFIVTSFLYSITKSKVSFIMNLAEFVPFLGDFLPVYTASTIIWILRESGYDDQVISKRILSYFSNLLFVSDANKRSI
jgi:hypothetical protein